MEDSSKLHKLPAFLQSVYVTKIINKLCIQIQTDKTLQGQNSWQYKKSATVTSIMVFSVLCDIQSLPSICTRRTTLNASMYIRTTSVQYSHKSFSHLKLANLETVLLRQFQYFTLIGSACSKMEQILCVSARSGEHVCGVRTSTALFNSWLGSKP